GELLLGRAGPVDRDVGATGVLERPRPGLRHHVHQPLRVVGREVDEVGLGVRAVQLDRVLRELRPGGRRRDVIRGQRLLVVVEAHRAEVAGHRVYRAALADLVPGPRREVALVLVRTIRDEIDQVVLDFVGRKQIELDLGDIRRTGAGLERVVQWYVL